MRLRSKRLRALSMPLIAGALVAGLLVPLASPAPVSAQVSGLHGRVLSGATPLQGFEVTLYATAPGGGPDALATATSVARRERVPLPVRTRSLRFAPNDGRVISRRAAGNCSVSIRFDLICPT